MDRRQTCRIGNNPMILSALCLPTIKGVKQRVYQQRWSRTKERPASFLAPGRQSGIAKYLYMARNTRLALPQNLGKFAYGQFHFAQKCNDSQPGRIGKGTEYFERRRHCPNI